jgi:hypothetical protein
LLFRSNARAKHTSWRCPTLQYHIYSSEESKKRSAEGQNCSTFTSQKILLFVIRRV